jgi:hypothetical protein
MISGSSKHGSAAKFFSSRLAVLCVLATIGCGGSSEPQRSNSHAAFERADHLHISPLDACSYHRLQAGGLDFVSGFGSLDESNDPRFERLSWRVNGDEVHRGAFLESHFFHRDDIVELAHLGDDGKSVVESCQITILNSPPRVTSVNLAPTRDAGNTLECHIAATDPDNEPMSFEFEWKLDGERFPGANGAKVSLRDLRKGQKIGVTVRAFDGSAYSQPFTPREYVITNLPPTIGAISQANVRTTEDGTRLLSIKLELADPDGDPLEVAFQGVPSNYDWNQETGVLQWVFQGAAEARTVQVRVSDGRGAVVQHQLEIAGEVSQSR